MDCVFITVYMLIIWRVLDYWYRSQALTPIPRLQHLTAHGLFNNLLAAFPYAILPEARVVLLHQVLVEPHNFDMNVWEDISIKSTQDLHECREFAPRQIDRVIQCWMTACGLSWIGLDYHTNHALYGVSIAVVCHLTWRKCRAVLHHRWSGINKRASLWSRSCKIWSIDLCSWKHEILLTFA